MNQIVILFILLMSAFLTGALFVLYRQNRRRAIRDYLGWHCGITVLGALVSLDFMQSDLLGIPVVVETVVLCILLLFLAWMTIRLSFVLTKQPFPRYLPWVNLLPVLLSLTALGLDSPMVWLGRFFNGWLILTCGFTMVRMAIDRKLLNSTVKASLKTLLVVFAVCVPLFILEIVGVKPVKGSAYVFFLIWNVVGLFYLLKSPQASASLLSVRSVPLSVSERYHLTPREIEIINLVISGKNTKDIADGFSRSDKTVKNHISNIYSKMGISNRLELLATISSSLMD